MALTNTQVIDNLIALLEKVKNNDSIDDVPDIKKLLTKLNNKAIKGKTIIVIKTKETQEDTENNPVTKKKLTDYQLFVKEKMPELKKFGTPSNERFSKIAEMWNEFNPKKDKEPKKPKEPKEPKKPKETKEPKKLNESKKPKGPKKPKKNNKKPKETQDDEEQDNE